jgi:ligand-binding sensor domain-containing protein/signal transduction histidine kinase/DNA-binding response OmpR family regulator
MKITRPGKAKYLILSLIQVLLLGGYCTQACGQTFSGSALTIDQGLINNEVTAIHQDKYGFLWFGTRGGLNRYDGYEFKVIRSHPRSKNNLSNQAVECVYEGENDNLWIGTKSGGLNRYDMRYDTIYHHVPPKKSAINIQSIQSLLESDGRLYIGALNGLYQYNIRTKQYKCIKEKIKVSAFVNDGKRGLWAGTNQGLFFYDKFSHEFTKIDLKVDSNVQITSLVIDDRGGIIYMGTWRKGVLAYHLKTRQISQYLHDPANENSLSSNNAYRMFLDSSGNLWIGTWGGGLNRLDIAGQKLYRHHFQPERGDIDINDIILSIVQDRSGIIWVGTDGGGVGKIDPKIKKFNNITFEANGSNVPNHPWVLSIYEEGGRLWVGTKSGGLSFSGNRKDFSKIDLPMNARSVRVLFADQKDLWVGTERGLVIFKDGLLNHRAPKATVPQSLIGIKINAITRDRAGSIWVGTQEFGLTRVTGYTNEGQPLIKRYAAAPGKKGRLQNERISCLLSDKRGRLWIGTYNGLHLYNSINDDFVVYQQDSEPSSGLSNNTILSISEDNKGNIWIGTQHGLNKIAGNNEGRVLVENFFAQHGFPNDYVHAVLADRQGNVWMSTNSGLVKYDMKRREFRDFDTRDGLRTNVFTENSALLSPQGEMFFGSTKGLTAFFPDSITLNKKIPPVQFTQLKINNELINVRDTVAGRVILSKALFARPKLTLSYKQNVITLFFSALEYHASYKNQYAYKLTGFDEKWVYAGKRHSVTYTNLSPGEYTFKVMVSNSDKVWSKTGASLHLKILPPPWKSWWAYTIYALIFAGFLWLSRYLGLSRMRLRNKLEIANLNYRRQHEIAEVKSKVFANVSHEFRTPLTLMVGPLDDLSSAEGLDPKVKTIVIRVQNQTKRLLKLVNQLLDFQKAEAGSLLLHPKPTDIVMVAQLVFDSFLDEAGRKGLRYTFVKRQDQFVFAFDKEKTEIILYNMLSNAFKFTPDGGAITFSVGTAEIENKTYCKISVRDTGKGISEKDMPRVFDRYYQSTQPDHAHTAGTGIGLAFIKELVDLHAGKIQLESSVGLGTTLIICLPVNINEVAEQGLLLEDQDTALLPSMSMTGPACPTEELPVILLVEDNREISNYVCSVIEPFSKVVLAANGQKGLDMAFKYIPDLVITDVMMPVMDGMRMCALLKHDERTSHIPVIMLTAKSDDLSHIQGVDMGADSYISKPFNPGVLKSHIHNLIEQRRRLRDQFARSINLEPGQLEISSFEEDFIKNAIIYIENHISKTDLNPDALAETSNMSRSTFYRKLKAITGLSGSEFIKLIRLKRSTQILKSGKYSISQAAFETGFNDVKHFRKSFQKQFGVTPSVYVKSKEINIDLPV